jgi:hypothetical protein
MHRGKIHKSTWEILTDTICPSRVVSRIASKWVINPVTQEHNTSRQNCFIARSLEPGILVSADERTFVGLEEVGVDGSTGCGGTLLGQQVVALPGPGLAENN